MIFLQASPIIRNSSLIVPNQEKLNTKFLANKDISIAQNKFEQQINNISCQLSYCNVNLALTGLAISVISSILSITGFKKYPKDKLYLLMAAISLSAGGYLAHALYEHFKTSPFANYMKTKIANSENIVDNELLKPANAQINSQIISQIMKRDIDNNSFASRIADGYKQAKINGFGFSVFDTDDILNAKAIQYLEDMYNIRGNKPFKQLFWITHGSGDSDTLGQLITTLTQKNLLEKGGVFISDGCKNVNSKNFDDYKRLASSLKIHIYASDKNEIVGVGFTNGFWHFFPDSRTPVREKPPMR